MGLRVLLDAERARAEGERDTTARVDGRTRVQREREGGERVCDGVITTADVDAVGNGGVGSRQAAIATRAILDGEVAAAISRLHTDPMPKRRDVVVIVARRRVHL